MAEPSTLMMNADHADAPKSKSVNIINQPNHDGHATDSESDLNTNITNLRFRLDIGTIIGAGICANILKAFNGVAIVFQFVLFVIRPTSLAAMTFGNYILHLLFPRTCLYVSREASLLAAVCIFILVNSFLEYGNRSRQLCNKETRKKKLEPSDLNKCIEELERMDKELEAMRTSLPPTSHEMIAALQGEFDQLSDQVMRQQKEMIDAGKMEKETLEVHKETLEVQKNAYIISFGIIVSRQDKFVQGKESWKKKVLSLGETLLNTLKLKDDATQKVQELENKVTKVEEESTIKGNKVQELENKVAKVEEEKKGIEEEKKEIEEESTIKGNALSSLNDENETLKNAVDNPFYVLFLRQAQQIAEKKETALKEERDRTVNELQQERDRTVNELQKKLQKEAKFNDDLYKERSGYLNENALLRTTNDDLVRQIEELIHMCRTEHSRSQ